MDYPALNTSDKHWVDTYMKFDGLNDRTLYLFKSVTVLSINEETEVKTQ